MGNWRALAILDATSRVCQWRALSISLRALRHPLTLASIGLLLLNDHVLKGLMPSLLTGKLSDFAGLFFFPFLLAAFLSLFLDRLRIRPCHTAALAFGITLAWFALIKTVPGANALMVDALSRLLGVPVQIVLDPTDLLALVMLWPAWLLWVRLEQTPSRKQLGKAAYLALGLAALATMATSIPPEERVSRLVVFEDSVYAGLAFRAYGWQTYTEIIKFYRSDDGGRTWYSTGERYAQDETSLPAEVAQQIQQPAQRPVTVCDPANPQICYRITGAEQVEGSTDGGQTWQVVWQVPPGRRKFMERYVSTVPYKWEVELYTCDLVLLSQDGETAPVVALGNEGVLVRTPEGTWQRYEVGFARPTPYTGDLGFMWLFLLRENRFFMTVANLVWLVCCILGWQIILSKTQLASRRLTWEIITPAILAVPPLLHCFLPDWFLHPMSVGPCSLLMPTAALLVFVGPAFVWRDVVGVAHQPKPGRRAAWACFFAALGIFPLAWLPFPLWVLGIIPVYEIALALSVLIGIAVLVCGVYAVRRLSRRAVTPVETITSKTEVTT